MNKIFSLSTGDSMTRYSIHSRVRLSRSAPLFRNKRLSLLFSFKRLAGCKLVAPALLG